MRHTLKFALAALALVSIAGIASAEPKTLTLDRAHCEVGFNVKHFFSKVHGSFSDFDGTIVYDPAKLATSSVQVTVRDSSVSTGNDRRDADLRTENFFWVEKYPLITFKSTKVVPGADADHFQVLGDLTIRGVTKPVTLDAEVLGMGPITIEGHDWGTRAGFEAKTTINRKDFGIVWNRAIDQGGLMLADDVEIVLGVEAFTRPAVAAANTPKPAPPTTTKK